MTRTILTVLGKFTFTTNVLHVISREKGERMLELWGDHFARDCPTKGKGKGGKMDWPKGGGKGEVKGGWFQGAEYTWKGKGGEGKGMNGKAAAGKRGRLERKR